MGEGYIFSQPEIFHLINCCYTVLSALGVSFSQSFKVASTLACLIDAFPNALLPPVLKHVFVFDKYFDLFHAGIPELETQPRNMEHHQRECLHFQF
jgi:hypothetical protein